MQGRRLRNMLLAAGLALVFGAVAGLVIALQTGGARADPLVSASVGSSPVGRPQPSGFVGLSLEYNWLHVYTGLNPKAVDPVLEALIRNLVPGGQRPVLRIGGESTDGTWWPTHRGAPPAGIYYSVRPRWLQTVRALARAVNARMIMGVNFAANRPGLAASEARAFLAGIGRRYIQAFEIGNEPDNYGVFPWYRTAHGHGKWVLARPSGYSLSDFIAQFSRFRAALPPAPVAGPAFAELTWLDGLGQFLTAEPKLSLTTVHRYALHGCLTDPSSPSYPSVTNLLSDQASGGLAQAIAASVSTAHAHGVPFRLDELNSASVASCLGKRGVSGTFASALWVLDTLFNLASVGVDGVNVHTLPTAAYELFTIHHHRRAWWAFVHPEYYGMLMFVQAFPPGAQLLPVSTPDGPLKIWATRDSRGTVRTVLINKDPSESYQVQLQAAGESGPGKLERLEAPTLDARGGVILGGRTFGGSTRSGRLPGPPQTETVTPADGTYSVTLPPGTAALLTL